MPSPLILWLLAVGAGALGVRERRRRSGVQRAQPDPVPGLLRTLARLPVPASLAAGPASHNIESNIAAAALGATLTAAQVARARLASAQAGLAFGAVLAVASPPLAIAGIALAIVGYVLPTVWLVRAARMRRARVVADLPDLIDVVVLCAQAGMPLEPALRLACQRLGGPCAEEVQKTLGEMDLGAPRRTAYTGLAERIGAPEVRALVGALLQADELGTPVSETLHRHAVLLRAGRRQAVRDRAARAAPKVQLVVAMVMVPGALLVVAGVMVLELIRQLGTVAGGMP